MPEETPSKHDFTQVVEIAQIQLSHLNNGAHFQFMKNVSDRLATDTKIKENAVGQAAIKALTEALAAEDKYLVLSQKSLLTDDIIKADRERDTLFAGYRTAVKGFLNMPVADLAKHAHQLWQHLVDYAIDPKMQLERETGLITNLCTDLAGAYATQVQALGFVLERHLPSYAGNLPDHVLSQVFASASGRYGTTRDYVEQTAHALRSHAMPDRNLEARLKRCKSHSDQATASRL